MVPEAILDKLEPMAMVMVKAIPQLLLTKHVLFAGLHIEQLVRVAACLYCITQYAEKSMNLYCSFLICNLLMFCSACMYVYTHNIHTKHHRRSQAIFSV